MSLHDAGMTELSTTASYEEIESSIKMIHFTADYISRFVRVLQMQVSRKSG